MAKYVRSKVPMEVALHLRSELSFALGKLVSVGTSILFKGHCEKKIDDVYKCIYIYIDVFCVMYVYIYIYHITFIVSTIL